MIEMLSKRETGSFYTCSSVADYISRWAISDPSQSLLEPSFGDGSFLYSAISRFAELGQVSPHIYGVELQKAPFLAFNNTGTDVSLLNHDFFDYFPNTLFDSIIGNPPYVRLKNLSLESREKALAAMKAHNFHLPLNASLWMPFVVHATELLKANGRLGFVLPYEITYVRYAFRLWDYLSSHFGSLSVIRVHEDFFPNVDVETIIFLADNKGASTDTVHYLAYTSLSKLFAGNHVINTTVSIADICNMKRPFEQAMLHSETKSLLNQFKESGSIRPLINDCKFKIGYVCGDKYFFHPTPNIQNEYNLSDANLLPCLRNAKEINGIPSIGVDTHHAVSPSKLFYPATILPGDKAYIEFGESQDVHKGFKCRNRSPWYITPSIEVPDLILTVFGDVPKLIANDGGFVVSNSLLSGIITSGQSKKEMICRWYNSLTLLMIELGIHSLGGGTLVLIPGEVDRLEIIAMVPEESIFDIYQALDICMIEKGASATYKAGDELVLRRLYHLSQQQIDSICESLFFLRSWRNPTERRS